MAIKRFLPDVYQIAVDRERSCLVITPAGNILVDTPEASEAMRAQIESLGGVKHLFITHRDDAGEACVYQARLGAIVAIHREDAGYVRGCSVDRLLEHGDTLTPVTEVVHLPGHSPGSSALLIERGGGVLFTGDALPGQADGSLRLPPEQYSTNPIQAQSSLRRLLDYDFEAIFASRGEPIRSGGKEKLGHFLAQLQSS